MNPFRDKKLKGFFFFICRAVKNRSSYSLKKPIFVRTMAKILFLTTAHHYNDDRIFFHQAMSLKEEGNTVKICSLSSHFIGNEQGIEIESYDILHLSSKEKTEKFLKICTEFQPDVVIASEPLAVIAASKFSKNHQAKVIYDITEWYPSTRMVRDFSFPLNIVHGFKFFLINLYAGFVSDGFIFGEPSKRFPLAYVFPFKKNILLPYFPDDNYIFQKINNLDKDKVKLCYTGVFSKEKGIGNFFAVIDSLQKKKPELKVSVLLIGSSRKQSDASYFESLLHRYQFENLEIRKPVPFEKFTENYSDADILFDLREKNFENDRCLPIKIFYYLGSGKPVIYTDLDATRNFMNVQMFGHLVNPEDSETIANYILTYIDQPELYQLHAKNAVEAFEKQYNWSKIRKTFVDFIENTVQ